MIRLWISTGLATILAGVPAGNGGWTPQTELDCQPYAEMLDRLKEQGQIPISGGALHDASEPDAGGVVIVATPRGESWTLVVLTSDGKQACAGAYGHRWQQSLIGRRMPTSLPLDGKPRMD